MTLIAALSTIYKQSDHVACAINAPGKPIYPLLVTVYNLTGWFVEELHLYLAFLLAVSFGQFTFTSSQTHTDVLGQQITCLYCFKTGCTLHKMQLADKSIAARAVLSSVLCSIKKPKSTTWSFHRWLYAES